MVTEKLSGHSSILPGIGVLFTIGVTARIVASYVPLTNYLIVAIFLGALLGNWYGTPEWAKSGVKTHKLWLEVGIVVMGASVNLGRVVTAGPTILILVAMTVLSTVLLVELLARTLFDVPQKTGSLLAAGSSICGVSAVVAIAGSIDPDESQIAYAAGTVLLFDAMTLLTYPVIGKALGLSDIVFGIWAGLTMFSTGPVTAAGFAFSNAAGEWALLVKLTRNALIGITAIGYATYYARYLKNRGSDNASPGGPRYLWRTFPKFVLGFLAVMLFANLGFLDQHHVTSLEHASSWAFMLAFAGLGLEIRIGELRSTGIKPVLLVLTSFLTISVLELVTLVTLF
ncbi:YeiH family protein [Halorussus salinisoli]|uniref:YeiH family protein n=1 Tax=Halorussus salinisoli TaxID=2558242 RepID=UPI0010C23C31|nr:putative sulfate exporter family transporter [Halorussus salinisoli]